MTTISRVSGAVTANKTNRVTGAITAGHTARTEIPSIDTIVSGGSDAWGGSWGTSWGSSWGSGGSSHEIFPASRRVTGNPSGGDTERIEVDYFLLLEGDESGFLLLEGDAAGYEFGLEGDETDPGGTNTKRVVQ